MDRVELNLEKVSNGAKVREDVEVGVKAEQKTGVTSKNDFVNNLKTEDDEACLDANCSVDLTDEKAVLAKAAAAEKTSNTAKTSYANYESSVVQVKQSKNNNSAAAKEISTESTKLSVQIANFNKELDALFAKLNSLTEQYYQAINSGNKYDIYVIEQQILQVVRQKDVTESKQSYLSKNNEKLKEYSATLDKYPNNKKIADIISKKVNLMQKQEVISEKKATAMLNEDEYAQYQLEMEENKINSELKQLEVDQVKEEATADGRVVSVQEINLLTAKLDTDFRAQRITEKMAYLHQKLSDIAGQKLTAEQNGDEHAQYVLEQQEASIEALMKIFEIDKANIEKQAQTVKASLDTVQKYPSTVIQGYSSEIAELNEQLTELAAKKATAMQNEDDYGQYLIELEENKIHEKLKELEIQSAKSQAKEDGRTFSKTEEDFIGYLSDAKFRLSRIAEKRQYLEYKFIGIKQYQSTAMQNEDEYAQYVLEQQVNSINALDKIFEMDQINLESQVEKLSQSLALLQKYPDNADLQNVLEEQYQLTFDAIGIAQQKSVAMQNEDENLMAQLINQEDNLCAKNKELEIKLQQIIANEEGRTLSLSEIKNIEANIDTAINSQRVDEIRQYLSYKLIGIAQQKTTAIYNKDEYAQYILEQQENAINALYKLSDNDLLSKCHDVSYLMSYDNIADIAGLDDTQPATDDTIPEISTEVSVEKEYFDDGSYAQLSLDANGNCVKAQYFDKKGNLQGTDIYEYDTEGNRISAKYYDGTNKFSGSTEMTYDSKGNQTGYKAYDENGNLFAEDASIYDYEGNLVQSKYIAYEADGSYSKRTNSYQDNQDVADILIGYDKNGSVNYSVYDSCKANYPYANCWNSEGVFIYFANGKSIEIKKGQAVQINADGTVEVSGPKGTVKYNKNGKKIS